MGTVRVKRVYDKRAKDDGYRVLVDRLWPRGVKKAELVVDEWAQDVAPSDDLRRWYGHDPQRFAEFARRYRAELRRRPGSSVLARLQERAAEANVTLLTATKDVDHSAAAVLVERLGPR